MSKYMLPIILFFSLNLSAQNLQQYRWQNRLLVIVDNGTDMAKSTVQLALLQKAPKGLLERKLVVYQFSTEGYKKGVATNNKWLEITNETNLIGSKNNEFTVYLIGLDGGIKMKKQVPVKLSTIFALIDGMPMRQAELRKG